MGGRSEKLHQHNDSALLRAVRFCTQGIPDNGRALYSRRLNTRALAVAARIRSNNKQREATNPPETPKTSGVGTK
jgi:hypothetical protein